MVNLDIQRLQDTRDTSLLRIRGKNRECQGHIHVEAVDRRFGIAVHHPPSLAQGIGMKDNERRADKIGGIHCTPCILDIPLAMGVIAEGERRAIAGKGADGKGELPT